MVSFYGLVLADIMFLGLSLIYYYRFRHAREEYWIPSLTLKRGINLIKGKFVGLTKDLISPVTKTPCLYYHVVVEENQKLNKSLEEAERRGKWRPILHFIKGNECLLDGSYKGVKINLAHIKVSTLIKENTKYHYFVRGENISTKFDTVLDEQFKNLDSNHLRYKEILIKEEEEYWVEGITDRISGGNWKFRRVPFFPIEVTKDPFILKRRKFFNFFVICFILGLAMPFYIPQILYFFG